MPQIFARHWSCVRAVLGGGVLKKKTNPSFLKYYSPGSETHIGNTDKTWKLLYKSIVKGFENAYKEATNYKLLGKLWLVWFSGLSNGLQTKRSLVQFPVRAHAWVAGQVPQLGACKRQLIDVSLAL